MMTQLCNLLAILAFTVLLATAAPQFTDPMSQPGFQQVQGAQPYNQGPQRDNSMVTFTTDKPQTPLGFIPSLDDAMKSFTGRVESLPYPNFAGFPLYPFTPYAQGLWWR